MVVELLSSTNGFLKSVLILAKLVLECGLKIEGNDLGRFLP
jgi:hypothetical protein